MKVRKDWASNGLLKISKIESNIEKKRNWIRKAGKSIGGFNSLEEWLRDTKEADILLGDWVGGFGNRAELGNGTLVSPDDFLKEVKEINRVFSTRLDKLKKHCQMFKQKGSCHPDYLLEVCDTLEYAIKEFTDILKDYPSFSISYILPFFGDIIMGKLHPSNDQKEQSTSVNTRSIINNNGRFINHGTINGNLGIQSSGDNSSIGIEKAEKEAGIIQGIFNMSNFKFSLIIILAFGFIILVALAFYLNVDISAIIHSAKG